MKETRALATGAILTKWLHPSWTWIAIWIVLWVAIDLLMQHTPIGKRLDHMGISLRDRIERP